MTEYNAASRASVREAQKAARIADANRLVVVRNIASSQEGRSYLWDALSGSHIFSSTYTESPIRSAFLEGERNVGLRLLGDIMAACPDQFLKMMREANERSNSNGAAGKQPGVAGRGGDLDEPEFDFPGGGDAPEGWAAGDFVAEDGDVYQVRG